MSRHLRRILGALLLLASFTPALAQGFDLTTHLGFHGVPKEVVERDDTDRVTTTTFSPNGHSATITIVTPAGKAVWTYSWDPETQLLTHTKRSVEPPVDGVTRSTIGFDERGRQAYELVEDKWGTFYYDYAYSEDGATLEVWLYLGDRPEGEATLSRTDRFDDQGRVVRMQIDDPGWDWTGTSRTYGEHGFPDTITSYNAAGEPDVPSKYEYELDEHGNWTTRIQYRWVERLGRYENEGLVTTRDITYF